MRRFQLLEAKLLEREHEISLVVRKKWNDEGVVYFEDIFRSNFFLDFFIQNIDAVKHDEELLFES